MEGGGAFTFKGATWESVKKKRQASTSIMDAIQYGPSIKALGFLEQTSVTGVFRPTEQVMPAVRAIDAIVSRSAVRHMFDPSVHTFLPEEVQPLNDELPPSEPSSENARSSAACSNRARNRQDGFHQAKRHAGACP